MNNNRGMKATGKLAFILFLFVSLLVGLGGRVYYIKTVHGQEYEIRAKTQQTSRYDKIIPPNRGSIVDRNKQVLAVSTTIYNIVLDARVLSQAKAEEQKKTLETLTATFPELDYATLQGYITINPETKAPNLDTNWKYLVKGVDRKVKEEMEAKEIKGIVYEKDTQRKYPLHTTACHVIGFNRSLGIEKQYDSDMAGSPGRSFISYDGTNSAVSQDFAPKDGNTVVTTLDYTIQQYAEQAVEQAITEFPAVNAAAIVMNPNTGEVLAMADTNKFDLDDPSNPLALSDSSFKAAWDTMSEEDRSNYLNKTWRNFNVSDAFEPGSIFKPMVVAMALEENIIKPTDTFYCPGSKQVADRKIRCNLISGHGTLDVADVLKFSCNVGMMDIGERLGRKLFYKYQMDFGFGSKTGIDLPAEASSPSWYYSEERIGPTELATMSFGQSFNCTPIQAITAFSAVINGGNLMKPYIVSQVIDKEGKIIKENKPEIVRKVISQQTSDIIRVDLKKTIEEGTGKKARIEGYSIGGKTGTAEQGDRKKNEHVLSYIAYLPVEDPDIIVMCIINRPTGFADGIQSPAPMTKALLQNIIKYKAIEPEYVSDESEKETKNTTGKTKLKDLTGQKLYDVVPYLDTIGLNSKVIGSGNLITNQVPHEGVEVEEESEILLYVTKEENETGDVSVPNVEGKSYNEAVTILNDAGLQVKSTGDEDGIVEAQNPKGGIYVDSSAITVEITLKQPGEK